MTPTTSSRIAVLPDVPTMAEGGVENFELGIWHGLYAPAGTDQAIIDRLAASLQKALTSETVGTSFAELGTNGCPENRRWFFPLLEVKDLHEALETYSLIVEL